LFEGERLMAALLGKQGSKSNATSNDRAV